MSTSSEFDSPASELDLDLHFLPAWAQKPATENRYAKYEGPEEPRPPRRGDRPGRRDFGRPRTPGGRERPGRPRPDTDRREPRARTEPRREPPPPPIELGVSFIPEEKGVESLARQIRLTGRAYPLFEIGFLILKKPDRYQIRFNTLKKADGQVAQPLFLCNLDETLWLSENEAVQHLLSKHFATFYQTEKTPAEPPKGTYTFVAQCGMSGTILGPPNYHDYQNKLRKLHADRFSRMPFEVFKSRVKIVKDEAVVKKWLEEQSWKTEYISLNMPEPLKLGSFTEAEKHFRDVHLPNIVRPVDNYTLSGTAAQALPSSALRQVIRRAWDEQMRFPLKLVNVLSQQFAQHGLQFFKVNRTVTHVAVARPRYLDIELTPISDGVKSIVQFISNNPKCTRRKLLEALAPNPDLLKTEPGVAQSETPPTPEMAAVISDLHWLIHQGHVIEFANGLMELAKKPAPKPPKPETQPGEPGADAASAETTGPEGVTTEAAAAELTTTEIATTETATLATAAPETATAESQPIPLQATHPEAAPSQTVPPLPPVSTTPAPEPVAETVESKSQPDATAPYPLAPATPATTKSDSAPKPESPGM